MALHRKIDWNTAMRDLRKDRAAPVAPGHLATRTLEIARLDRLAKEAAARPFFANGSFDRSAIMTAAIAKARLERAKGNKAPWSKLLGAALKSAWFHAKCLRALATH
jgi:hypothetical protein